MDIKTLLENLREEVSCSVCSDIFTDPKHLPCLHSFCLKCLKQWHNKGHGRDTIRCPNCQTVSRIPESGDLKDLPTSFYLNGLIDVLAIKERRSSQVRCGNCGKKSSETSYCFKCCVFWCEECLTGHNMMRNNIDHRVLALEDFKDNDYEDVLKHIEDQAERQKIEVKSMIETQRSNLETKMNIVSQLDEDYAKVIQQGEGVKGAVQRMFDNLMACLEAKKTNMFAAVEKEIKKSLESLTTQKSEIEHQIEVIKSSLDKADKVLIRSTNAEVVQLRKPLEKILEEVDQIEPTDRDPTAIPILVLVENQKLLETVNNEELGTLKISYPTQAAQESQSVAEGKGLEEGTVGSVAEFVLRTRDSEGRQCYNQHDRVTVERNEQGRECATEVRINDNKDGSYKISYSVRDQGRYKVTVKVNGRHIRDSPFCINVKSFQLKPVLSFGKGGSSVGMFDGPWGVAVNSNKDEIAVTEFLNHRVQIFDSDGNYLRSFGRRGNKAGEFINPRGITFHKNGNIFVADNGNHRIQIFSGEREYVGMFGGKGSLDSQLSYPYGLSVDSDGNIIVADTGNKLIKIFSPDGKFLMKVVGQGSLSFPIHCIQCDTYLIVSDRVENCIKVFDWNGNFQYKFGKQGGGDGEFKYPYCLSVNKSGHLMVCDADNNRIQVFELNGKFVGKFGTKGSNLGEFSLPQSLAVLRNSRIVVSEWGNKRIQILE